MPAAGIERTEPRVGEARGGFQIRRGGYGGEHGVAGFFVGVADGGINGGTRFNSGGAGGAGARDFFRQRFDGFGDAGIHHAEVVEGHPDRPVAAAVFETGKPLDQDARGGGGGVAGIDEAADGVALAGEAGVEGVAISGAGLRRKNEPGDEQFRFGQAGAGRREFWFFDGIHCFDNIA